MTFSVILPTMWLNNRIFSLLQMLESNSLIDEILIISNAKPPINNFSAKVKLLQQSENIGVNPAWNLGVSLSKNDKLCFVNDDVSFDNNVFEFLFDKITENIGIVGASLSKEKSAPELVETIDRKFGFGCLFFMHKKNYVSIPHSLKVFFGDDWLFTFNKDKKNYCIDGINFSTDMSTTSKNFNNLAPSEQNIYFIELFKKNIDPIKYSIIVPHYDGVISNDVLSRGISSLLNQEYKNFEILLYHDGPLHRDLLLPESEKIKVVVTQERKNDWGHSLRHLGIMHATGDYIIHFNPDNILYPTALKEITETIVDTKYRTHNNNIIIYPIYLMGYTALGDRHIRLQGEEDNIKIPLAGNPAVLNYIDCMQLVMKKYIWDYYGGWYDKSFAGDGMMYQRFVRENGGARYCSNILGEHR